MSSQNQKPASNFSKPAATIEEPAIKASNWRELSKNTLRGVFDLELVDLKIKLCGACYHEKVDARWVSMPGRPWVNKDGVQQWANIVEFISVEAKAAFQAAALRAVDELRGAR